MSQLYEDPVIRKYRNLIEAAMPGVFKGFFQGDPLRIPKSSMPALVISKTRTRVAVHTNAEDEHEIGLIISVITDMRDEIADEKSITPGVAQLYDIMEGRDEATLKLKAKSVLNVLRSNVLVDQALNLRTDLGSITVADYGLTVGKRGPEAYAIEGQVQLIASFNQVRV